ncbi:hypothetical protein GCM10010844_31940 [Deinococcus radiotolerans]|uniref:Uncharacterized protein n=1 Tax=Deinococcus radiotolerans TaxID=1309407 RepID=A0ABQ2FNA7_9DEIO|nr:hypothetical protein GCM10010844_31940 [Deinococcus radiotolerans]
MEPCPGTDMDGPVLLRGFQMLQMGCRPGGLIRAQKLGPMNAWATSLGTRTSRSIEKEPSIAPHTDKDADSVSVLELRQADRIVPAIEDE